VVPTTDVSLKVTGYLRDIKSSSAVNNYFAGQGITSRELSSGNDVTSQKTVLLIVTVVGTYNLIADYLFLWNEISSQCPTVVTGMEQ
jgi:hypothetical protein